MNKVLRRSIVMLLMSASGAVLAEDTPSAITHRLLPSGEHEYQIHGIYAASWDNTPKETDFLKTAISDCIVVSLDLTNRIMAFRTRSALTNLQQQVDTLAWWGGTPSWEELKLRDRRSVTSFDAALYQTVLKTPLPWSGDPEEPRLLSVTNSGSNLLLTFHRRSPLRGRTFLVDYLLTWTNATYMIRQQGKPQWISWRKIEPRIREDWTPWHKALMIRQQGKPQWISWRKIEPRIREDWTPWHKALVNYAPGRSGHAILTWATGVCFCHSRYTLRILDADGECVWEDQEGVVGTCSLTAADLTNDGIDEVVVCTHKHGGVELTVFGRAEPKRVSNGPMRGTSPGRP
jgi:hypothetical protein